MSFPRPLPLLTPGVALAQAVVLALLPHGGQHAARRNAWSSMAADAARGRARREAAAAVALAEARQVATPAAVRRQG